VTDIKKDILWRVYLVYFGILIFGFSIIGKIIYIQFKEGVELKAKAQTQELRVFDLEANRGNILDKKVVCSQPQFPYLKLGLIFHRHILIMNYSN